MSGQTGGRNWDLWSYFTVSGRNNTWDITKQSLSTKGPEIWNVLNDDVRNSSSDSLNCFKTKL